MARTLTKLDEWPLHQTIDTFNTVATASPNWSDGYWNCVGDPEGRVHMITATRFYANTNVADGYACVSLDDGKQYNLRCSRRLRPRIDTLEVGPVWMDIIEGLRTFRFGCRENPHGIEFDLLWEASAPAWDETPGQIAMMDGRVNFMRSNYVQVGNLSGQLRVGDRRFEVDEGWVGARDHSWGLGDAGTGGSAHRFAAPPKHRSTHTRRRPQFGMRQWALIRFPTRSVFYHFHHSNDGVISPFSSYIGYPFDSNRPATAWQSVEVEEVNVDAGRRRLVSAVVTFKRYGGKLDRFRMETISKPLYMQGTGYWGGFDDGLGRGVWRGEEHLEGDVWDVSHPTVVRDASGEVVEQRQGSWAETYARFVNLDKPEEEGIGLLECVFGGPYPGIDDDD